MLENFLTRNALSQVEVGVDQQGRGNSLIILYYGLLPTALRRRAGLYGLWIGSPYRYV